MFVYWKCVIDLQIKVLLYVRSIHEGNFKLHVEVMYKLLSWYFVIYDYHNYACWLTIHFFDLYIIDTKFPDVYNFLSKGSFSFQNSHLEFSRMGLDQTHEQNNKLIKGCGGANYLLNKVKDSALFRWETWSPEIARVILEFEDCLDRNEILAESSTKHHEDSQPFYERFSFDINRLIKCITANPFVHDHLTKLNNKKYCSRVTGKAIDDLDAMVEKQLETVYGRLVVRYQFHKKITLNKMEIWNHTVTGQLEWIVNFLRPNLHWRKWIHVVNTEKL